jgi:hypothetical protein
MSDRIAYFGKRSPASERVGNERVPAMMDREGCEAFYAK